jgi:YD repeat-containing protein
MNYITATASEVVERAVISYTYDPLYHLTGADYSGGVTATYAYAYDAVGNRTAMTDTAGSHTYTYDDANRLTKVDGVTYTWDDNGNLLSDGTRTFTYDAGDRLMQVVSGTVTTTFAYNGDGHRMRKVADGVTTTYVVALLDLPQVVVETTGGSSTAYLHGHDLPGLAPERRSGLGAAVGGWRWGRDAGAGVHALWGAAVARGRCCQRLRLHRRAGRWLHAIHIPARPVDGPSLWKVHQPRSLGW